METQMNSRKTSKNIFKHISFFLLMGILISGCIRPEVIIHDPSRISAVKLIQLLPVEVHSLNFDPYLSRNLEALTGFELQRAGYSLVRPGIQNPIQSAVPIQGMTNNTNRNSMLTSIINPDATLKISIMHSKSFRNIDEEDSLTLLAELIGQ